MKLSLSTAAAPGAELAALDTACLARGLDGIELVVGDGDDAETMRARASGARLVALRAERPSDLRALVRAAGELGVALSVPADVAAALGKTALADLAAELEGRAGSLLLGVTTDLDRVVRTVALLDELGRPASVSLAWELRPNEEDLRVSSGAVLLSALDHLRLVRLHGGGPEQREQDGRGVGAVFVDLAIAGYKGPIVLTPSSEAKLPDWKDWLASRKIAGCGTRHAAENPEVDVRYVEPKDRLATILGAFGALEKGATLHITLDHDPSCMYYALEETQPAGSFAFRKVGDGPTVWGAEIEKI